MVEQLLEAFDVAGPLEAARHVVPAPEKLPRRGRIRVASGPLEALGSILEPPLLLGAPGPPALRVVEDGEADLRLDLGPARVSVG